MKVYNDPEQFFVVSVPRIAGVLVGALLVILLVGCGGGGDSQVATTQPVQCEQASAQCK